MFARICDNCKYLSAIGTCMFCTPNGKIPFVKIYCSYLQKKNKDYPEKKMGETIAKNVTKGIVWGGIDLSIIFLILYMIIWLFTPYTDEEIGNRIGKKITNQPLTILEEIKDSFQDIINNK
jgi:hypothetical protein